MDHFPIIQALCRTVIADSSPATRQQLERLKNALERDGEVKQAKALANIIYSVDRNTDMASSRIVRSELSL